MEERGWRDKKYYRRKKKLENKGREEVENEEK